MPFSDKGIGWLTECGGQLGMSLEAWKPGSLQGWLVGCSLLFKVHQHRCAVHCSGLAGLLNAVGNWARAWKPGSLQGRLVGCSLLFKVHQHRCAVHCSGNAGGIFISMAWYFSSSYLASPVKKPLKLSDTFWRTLLSCSASQLHSPSWDSSTWCGFHEIGFVLSN